MQVYFDGMALRHAAHLRNQIGGGKTSARFRRFSSSTPTRLADGLGPKRFTPRRKAIRPEELDPPFPAVPGIRLVSSFILHSGSCQALEAKNNQFHSRWL
jgi:hypothetical protein